MQFAGVDPLQAGNVVQLVLVLGLTIGWISTYIFRVSNKEMTYAQQIRDYESKVMEVSFLLNSRMPIITLSNTLWVLDLDICLNWTNKPKGNVVRDHKQKCVLEHCLNIFLLSFLYIGVPYYFRKVMSFSVNSEYWCCFVAITFEIESLACWCVLNETFASYYAAFFPEVFLTPWMG